MNFWFIGMVKTEASLPFFALSKAHKDTQNSTPVELLVTISELNALVV